MSSLVIVGSRPCSVAPVRRAVVGHCVRRMSSSFVAPSRRRSDSDRQHCPDLVEQFHSDDCQKVFEQHVAAIAGTIGNTSLVHAARALKVELLRLDESRLDLMRGQKMRFLEAHAL